MEFFWMRKALLDETQCQRCTSMIRIACWIKVENVIMADGEKNPTDKSAEEYPDGYYMDVFNVDEF